MGTRQHSSRRQFLGTSARVLGGALATPYFLTAAQAQDAQSEAPSDRPVIALIGCGGQGRWDMGEAMRFGDVAAVCDVDSEHLARPQTTSSAAAGAGGDREEAASKNAPSTSTTTIAACSTATTSTP